MNISKLNNIAIRATALSAVVCVALSLAVVTMQSKVLQLVEILHDPKLVWTHQAVHQHYLQQTRYRSAPIPIQTGRKGRVECRRPAYFILSDGEFEATSPAASCKDDTQVQERWAQFGEKFRLVVERKESVGNPRLLVPVNLAFSDGRSILNRTVVELGTNGGDRIRVNLVPSSSDECATTYRDGRLSIGSNSSACATAAVRALHISISESPTHSHSTASLSACSDGSVRLLAHGRGSWRTVTGTLKGTADFSDVCTSPVSVPLPCADQSVGRKRAFRLSSMANGLSVMCTSNTRLPKTDVERLAAFAADEGKPVRRSKSLAVTTIDASLDAALNSQANSGIGLPDGMEVVVLNASAGEIVGMASRRSGVADESDRMPVANFALRAPGSVAKIPFAYAALEAVRDADQRSSVLAQLVLHDVRADGKVGRNAVSCRIASGVIPGCRENSDLPGSYPTHGGGSYNFHRFLVESENQYAVALTYLASSAPIPVGATCNNRFSFAGGTATEGGKLSLGGDAQALDRWLQTRTPVVNDSNSPQCAAPPELPWLRIMRHRFGVAEPGRAHRRAEIWGEGELSRALVGVAPEREHFGLGRAGVERATLLTNGYVQSQLYKVPFGSGEGLWSNIGIVAASTDAILGVGVGARLYSSERPLAREPMSAASIAIGDGLAGVVVEREGTAHLALCGAVVNCSGRVATIAIPAVGTLEILAKTGTPTARPAASSPASFDRAFERLAIDADFVRQCDAKCVRLTQLGEERFQRAWTSIKYARHFDRSNVRDEKAFRLEYLTWLRERVLANVEFSVGGIETEPESEKRLLVVLRRPSDSHACSIYVTSRSGALKPVALYMRKLIADTAVHRACGFLPK